MRRVLGIWVGMMLAVVVVSGLHAEGETQEFRAGVLSFVGPKDMAPGESGGFDSYVRRFANGEMRFSYEWTYDSEAKTAVTAETLAAIIEQWREAEYPESLNPRRGEEVIGAVTVRGHDEFSAKRPFPNYLYLMCEDGGAMGGYLCLHLYFADSVPVETVRRLVESIEVVEGEE